MAYPKIFLLTTAACLSLNSASWAAKGSDAWAAYLAGDHKKALQLALKAAETGDLNAESLLGYLYETGDQVPKDRSQAQAWFKNYAEKCRQLADKGDSNGEHGLGWMYQNGWGGMEQNNSEAASWYRKAAEQGNQWSQFSLAGLYQSGSGVKQDYAEAAKWYRRAADQGNYNAMDGLAWLYWNGWGVKQDYAEAAKLYRVAADAGEPGGQHGLASLHYFGLGVKLDYAEAARLWQKSAEAGFPWAPWGLGILYRDGLGGFPKDHTRAIKWFKTGVERGDLINAATCLGVAYENGEGAVQDFAEAYKWYLLGAARDDAAAREGMNRLRQAMTKEQIAQAQKQASAFEASLIGKRAVAPMPEALAASLAPQKQIVSDVDKPAFKFKEDPERFALVVGIEKYKDLPAAEFAERDADAMRRTLLAMGYPERNVVVLKGAEATIASLRKYLDEWMPRNARKNATVFFYFSGHGAPDVENGSAYLVPWDGDASYLKSTAYPVNKLYATLGALGAKSVLVALDACFSGAGGRSVLAKGARPLVTKVDMRVEPNGKLTVFSAASGEQITSMLENEGHGAFTYYFLKGLGGAAKDPDGAVTAKGLQDYLAPQVEDAARRQNREQTPLLEGANREITRF